jgi:hypothetical protein
MTAKAAARVLACSALLLAAVAGDVIFFGLVWRDTYPVDGWFPGLPIDFKNTWFGAWSYWRGDLTVLFDQYAYNMARWRFFPLELGHIWSYPLHFLMLTLPLGLLSFPAAAVVWTLGNIVLYVWFVARRFRPSPGAWFFLLISSGFLSTVVFGQLAMLTSILLIGGLAILPRRPVLAGVFFGFLTIKPHFGALIPLFLLLERRWSTIAAAVVTTVILLGLSVLVFGPDAWLAFLRDGMPAQTEAMLEKRGLWSWEPTLYAAMRQLLFPRDVALSVQFVAAAAAGLAMVWLKWIGVSYEKCAELVPLLTLASLPYVLPADLLMIAPFIAIRLTDPQIPLASFVLLLVVQTFAAVFFIVSRLTDWPLYAAAFSAVVLLLVAEAWRGPARNTAAAPARRASAQSVQA